MARGTIPLGYLYVSRERAHTRKRRTSPLGKSDTWPTRRLGARGATARCTVPMPPIRAAFPRARLACVRHAREAVERRSAPSAGAPCGPTPSDAPVVNTPSELEGGDHVEPPRCTWGEGCEALAYACACGLVLCLQHQARCQNRKPWNHEPIGSEIKREGAKSVPLRHPPLEAFYPLER